MPIVRRHESFFVSAGEISGDVLGADLVLAIRERLPRIAAFGVAGPAMVNAGVEAVGSIHDFSVMGVLEVARRIPDLKMLESRLLHEIERRRPSFAVLIDNPGFHLRLAEQLRIRGVKVFQYVAPKLWAWGAHRATKLRENIDLVLGILPFEEEFFKERSIQYAYVGSPLKDRTDKVMIGREALGICKDMPLIACLPGSRPTEVKRILPLLMSVGELVRRKIPNAVLLVPLTPNISIETITGYLDRGSQRAQVKEIPDGRDFAVKSYEFSGLRFVHGMSLEIMAAADAAVVASGTATLECALLCTPMVVIYSMNDLTYQIAKRAVKVPYVSLVNLMAGRKIVTEFIQDFSLDDVANEVVSLIEDLPKRQALIEKFEDIRDKLKGTAAATAAHLIVERATPKSHRARIRM